MKDNKIIITGGAGFIGSHLTKELIKNNEVLVLDNLETSCKNSLPEEARFEEVDIRNRSKLSEVIDEFNPSIIFHLAAYNDAIGSIKDTEKCISTNVIGTVNLLELCKEYDINKIVYASSGGLSYGEPKRVPMDEAHGLKPVYPYGVTKSCGSLFISDYARRYELDFAVLRLGSVYGPRANGGVMKNFFEKIRDGESPVIFGDGSQTRDFVYVSDVVKGLVAAAEQGHGYYNIGTESQISILELFNLIKSIVGHNMDPIFKDRWQGDIDRCELSIDKSKNELNWSPDISLEEGLNKCKNYYMEV